MFGRFALNLFICVGKMRHGIKSHRNGYVSDRKVGRFQQVFGFVASDFYEFGDYRFSVFCFECMRNIIFVEIKYFG